MFIILNSLNAHEIILQCIYTSYISQSYYDGYDDSMLAAHILACLKPYSEGTSFLKLGLSIDSYHPFITSFTTNTMVKLNG